MRPKSSILFSMLMAAILAIAGYTFFGKSSQQKEVSIIPPLDYPEEDLEQIEIRAFTDPDRQWLPAGQINTAKPRIYEIRAKNEEAKEHFGVVDWNQLYTESLLAAKKHGWFDFDKGLSDGYKLFPDTDAVHYINPEYTWDGETLNPDKPEVLMYYPTPEGMVFTGIMYLSQDIKTIPPQFDNDNVLWHLHRWTYPVCWIGSVPITPELASECKDGTLPTTQSPLMVHLWFVEHPEGPYATSMVLPDNVLHGISGQASMTYAWKIREAIMRKQEKLQSKDP